VRRALAALAAVAVLAGCGVEDSTPEERRAQDRAGLVGPSPRAVAAGLGSVWVVDDRERSLWRFKPSPLRRLGAPVRLPATPVDVAAGRGAVWVVARSPSVLLRLDPRTGRLLGRAPLPGEPVAVDAGDGGLWVALRRPDAIVPFAGASGLTRGRPLRLPAPPREVSARDAALWVALAGGRRLLRVDPATGAIRRSFRAPNGLDALAAGDSGAAWFAQGEEAPYGRAPTEGDYLELLDSTSTEGSVDVAVGPRGSVYVMTGEDSSRETNPGGSNYTAYFRTILRLDPRTGEVGGTARVGDDARALAAGEGAAWVVEPATGDVPSGSNRLSRTEP
jgi:streptogramin lyase